MSTWLAWTITAVLVSPILFIALRFWYGFAVMANGWAQAFLVGLGFGMVIVLSAAMEDGIDAVNAQGMLIGAVAVTLIMKVVHFYIEPLWANDQHVS